MFPKLDMDIILLLGFLRSVLQLKKFALAWILQKFIKDQTYLGNVIFHSLLFFFLCLAQFLSHHFLSIPGKIMIWLAT